MMLFFQDNEVLFKPQLGEVFMGPSGLSLLVPISKSIQVGSLYHFTFSILAIYMSDNIAKSDNFEVVLCF